jgi:hypothetical protein
VTEVILIGKNIKRFNFFKTREPNDKDILIYKKSNSFNYSYLNTEIIFLKWSICPYTEATTYGKVKLHIKYNKIP